MMTLSSQALAYKMINERVAPVHLTPKDVVIQDVRALPVTELYNTVATLAPAKGSRYQESIEFQYDRIDVNTLFGHDGVKIEPGNYRLISEYLPSINEKYKLALEESDIIDAVIKEAPPPFKFPITVKEDNVAFYGQVMVTVTDEEKSLKRFADAITGAKINLGQLKHYQGNKHSARLLSYGINFTEIKNDLLWLTPNALVNEELTTVLNYYFTLTQWVNEDIIGEYNLHQAKIIYNGSTEHAPSEQEVCKRYDHVCIIKLDPNYCSNLSGELVLHYNTN